MNVSQQTFWFLRSNYKSQSKWACCEKSDGLSYDGLKEVSSFQSDLTHNIIRGTIEVEKKKWIRIEFWHIPELIAHLEYNLSPATMKWFKKKEIYYHKHNKTYFCKEDQ